MTIHTVYIMGYKLYLLFFETTIMGKTADLAMIQKTNIDALHKEGKSQKVITERCGCLQSAVSKHIKCNVENTVKQSWFKYLGELHKEWTEAGVSASRVTTLRRLQEKGYQALFLGSRGLMVRELDL